MALTPEQWSSAKDLFAQALAIDAGERHGFLRSLTCDSDTRLLVAQLVDEYARMPAEFLDEPSVFVPGQMLRNRFRIIRLIGRGGMGQVYEAEDLQLEQRVALKTLHAHLPSDESLARLKDEITNARRVTNPSVCRVYDLDVEQVGDRAIFFLTMELLEGETLAERLERVGPMSAKQALPLIRQCGAALDAAHLEGIVHGDFKASNILLCRFATGEERAVVTDFGLSRALEGGSGGEPSWGTPKYMAPELFAGCPATAASDVYAFGIVIRELVGLEPDNPGRRPGGTGRKWHRVIECCLEHDPRARLPLASDGSAMLEPTPARSWTIVGIAATLSIALLTVLVASTRSRERLAVLPFDVIPENEDAGALARGLVQLLASQLSSLAPVQTSFLVIAPAEIAEHDVASPSQAQRAMGATTALSGSLQRRGDRLILTVNRIDTRTLDQRSVSKTFFIHEVAALQRALLEAALDLLDVELPPETIARVMNDDSMSPAYEFYLQGLGYLNRGPESAESALSLFRLALERDPRFTAALAGAAEANLYLFNATKTEARLQEARQQLEAAERLGPPSVSLYMAQGFYAVVTGRFAEAAVAYEAGKNLEPFNGDIYRKLANVYRRTGNIEGAETAFKQAILMRPDYWAGYLDLGVFYYQRGQIERAESCFKQVTELAPDNVRGHVNLGGIYTLIRRYPEAERELGIALKLNPTASAYSNLGALLSRQQRYSEAIALLIDGAAAHPRAS